MKILGFTWNSFNSSDVHNYYGLFIKLPISSTNDSTLGESIFGRSEHQRTPKGKKRKSRNLNLIGKNIMGLVQNSNNRRILKNMVEDEIFSRTDPLSS